MIKLRLTHFVRYVLLIFLLIELQPGFTQQYYEPISYPDTLEIISMYPFNYDTILIGTTCDNSYFWGCAYITYDGGETWQYAGLQNHFVYCFLRGNGDTIYAGASQGIFRTVNYGVSWDQLYSFVGNVVCLARLNPGLFFAGTWGVGIVRSLDNGSTWDTSLVIDNTSIINSVLIVSEDEIYAGGTSYVVPGGGVFMTNDLGESWENIGLVSYNVQCLAKNQNDELYAGCYYSGLLKTSNLGFNWEEVLPHKDVLSIIINTDGIYLGCDNQSFLNGGIFFSSDNGFTWADYTFNITNKYVQKIIITNDLYFYSLSRSSITAYGPPLYRSMDPVLIKDNKLNQNSNINIFPNPASSYITLDLPSYFIYQTNYEINIYNQKGQLIFQDSLIISSQHPTINLSKIKASAGIYYLKIISDNSNYFQKLLIY